MRGYETVAAGGSIMTMYLTIPGDQLKHKRLAEKKAKHKAGQLTDPQLEDLAASSAGEHRGRYDRLLGYLNSHGLEQVESDGSIESPFADESIAGRTCSRRKTPHELVILIHSGSDMQAIEVDSYDALRSLRAKTDDAH